jgi:hypothetical protein
MRRVRQVKTCTVFLQTAICYWITKLGRIRDLTAIILPNRKRLSNSFGIERTILIIGDSKLWTLGFYFPMQNLPKTKSRMSSV